MHHLKMLCVAQYKVHGFKILQLYNSLFNKLVFNKDNKQILPKLKHIAQSHFVAYYASYYLWNITPSKNISQHGRILLTWHKRRKTYYINIQTHPYINRIYTYIYSHCVCVCSVMSESLQPHGLYNPPDSSVHEIFQERILEWVATSFFRRSSWPRDWTHVPCSLALQADSLPTEPPGKPIFRLQFTKTIPKCR